MSTVRIQRRGAPAPRYRVVAQPPSRGVIFVGDYLDEAEANRADDDARMWLFRFLLLRCSTTTGWHDRARVHRVIVLGTQPYPPCPPRVARWLRLRGWDVPAPQEQKKLPVTVVVEAFLRRLQALETGVEIVEARLSGRPAGGTELQQRVPKPFLI